MGHRSVGVGRRQLLAGLAAGLMLPRRGLALPHGGSGSVSVPVNYNLNLAAITTPAIPTESCPLNGTGWATATDGSSVNYLTSTGLNDYDQLAMPGSTGGTVVMTFTAAFTNASQPVNSYIYPSFCMHPGGEYEIQMARGSGATGALQVQKQTTGGTSVISSVVGTAGTTFTHGDKYQLTATASATGSTTSIVVQAQRTSDSKYLTSAGAWSATQQNAITVSDSSSAWGTAGGASIRIYQSAQDVAIYAFGMTNYAGQPTRYGTSPVLTKGGTYDGWKADSLTVQGVVDDGTQYVMCANFWSNANAQWATGFFTCTYANKLTSWSYITGSLLVPTGGNYLLGDGGLYWDGSYVMSFVLADCCVTNPVMKVWSTTNLAGGASAWTVNNGNILTGDNGADNCITRNPVSGNYELYFLNVPPYTIDMWTSPDKVTWTSQGTVLAAPVWTQAGGGFGGPEVFYLSAPALGMPNGTRIMAADISSPGGASARATVLFYDPTGGTSWLYWGTLLSAYPPNAWEADQVFTVCGIQKDLGDGHGNIPRFLYVGSDNTSGTDATDSSIGLASLYLGGTP